jgi:hypothetical protein
MPAPAKFCGAIDQHGSVIGVRLITDDILYDCRFLHR